jgi:dihydrofolate reductase
MNSSVKPQLALIVAASENDVIGVDNDLPWRLSADLKRFKALTMGHSIIMGRKTFESIGRLLPGRKTVIVTRNLDFKFAGAAVVHSIEQALDSCGSQEKAFLTGGAEIYRLAMPLVDEIYLTRVHTQIDGDTFLPEIDWNSFELVKSESFEANEKNDFRFSFQHYRRR